MDKENSKREVQKLIEKYDNIVNAKRINKYNEEMTKKDFILPLFRALNWDIENSDEVSAEEKISKRRVDYSFRINGIPKFFLEAKSLKEDLDNPLFVSQAIEYSYAKMCNWAVLINFNCIKIFNAEWKTTNPLQSNLKTINYNEFITRFDELWLLSKDSFGKGLLDLEAEKWGKKSKRTRIDKQLLDDFTHFREILSKSIIKLNQKKQLSQEELDESVQKILNRLIFIRNCEDREIEENILIPKLREWENNRNVQFVKRLREIFDYFSKYNSEIFTKTLCDTLDIENEVLSEIINGLFYSKDNLIKYDFSAISADALGNIYEQYLGNILKKTEKRATFTKNITHRKEQGIYYTPTFIVEYIIDNTLGEMIRSKKYNVDDIKVLDPACGSGSFLIKAFDYFYRYYSNQKNPKQITLNLEDTIPYSIKEKILENNLYGIDLDKQAVEIARLNLLMKIVEKSEVLPNLKQNIERGNSLIDDEKIEPDKFLKWEEKFKSIFDKGGFDIVIGNPPYINAIELSNTVGDTVKEYWKNKYYTASGAYDIFVLFFEQSLKLCKDGGFVSFITPNKYLSSPYGRALRELIVNNYKLVKVLDLSTVKVFNDPSVYPIITIIQKTKPKKEYSFATEKTFSEKMDDNKKYTISSKTLKTLPDYLWGAILSDNISIIERIYKKCKILEDVAIVQATSTASEADEYSNYLNEKKVGLRIINTGTIDRYSTTYGLIRFLNKRRMFMHPYLDISKIKENRKSLYKNPKLIISKLALRIEGFLDSDGSFASINTNCVHTPKNGFNLEYLTGILNSKLISFIYSELFSGLKMSGGYFQFQAPQLRNLPIADATKNQKEELSNLVKKIISLKIEINKFEDKKTDKRNKIEEDILKIDKEIDNLVYTIYGITEDEKEIIESSLK